MLSLYLGAAFLGYLTLKVLYAIYGFTYIPKELRHLPKVTLWELLKAINSGKESSISIRKRLMMDKYGDRGVIMVCFQLMPLIPFLSDNPISF